MVIPVSSISKVLASSSTKIHTSTSITSEPDNAWVAARQSQITADQQVLRKRERDEPSRKDGERGGDDSEHDRQGVDLAVERVAETEDTDSQELSGESDRIGTRNFDDDTPFGERVAIL